MPYIDYRKRIFDDHVGWSADLARYMNNRSINTEYIIVNAEALQKKWAKENNFNNYSDKAWEKQIALEQIIRFRPDVLWVESVLDYFGGFIKEASPYFKKAVTWISCPTPKNLDFSGFSELITSDPGILKEQQKFFNRVIVTKPGFDPEILNEIKTIKRKHDLIFSGSISKDHFVRAEILAYLIKNGINIKIFSYPTVLSNLSLLKNMVGDIVKRQNVQSFYSFYKKYKNRHKLAENIDIIKTSCLAPVYGLEYYKTIGEARISLHTHISISGGQYSGAQRMFETTGVGTCLLTDDLEGNNKIFIPNKDVMTYNSKEHLLDMLKNMDYQSDSIKKIALAGQHRTLKYHTIANTFEDISRVFD